MSSLWGDDFVVKKVPTSKIINKIKNPGEAKAVKRSSKAASLPIDIRLDSIKSNVLRILGKYADNTQVIYTREDLHAYIDKAIENGDIAIDTETNNSLDPITCKLMGPCIYTPECKQAYIPINHVDFRTRKRLENQLTEQDIKEEFSRLSDTLIIMHNGKFDYQVIKCTTNLQLKVYWDTMVAARLLDENEKSAGLKQQYHDKIDSSDEKYSIDHLFEDIEYALVPPEVFALYAATDAFKTYKLYKWQLEQFSKPENERLRNLFLTIEMPVMEVAADMELTGICIDADYAKRLSEKYHKLLEDVKAKVNHQLLEYEEEITAWRKTADANCKVEKTSKRGVLTYTKSKNEQLKNPPELTSPTQLAILLYDVLKVPIVDKKTPRGTGEDILKKIDNPLCQLVLEQRGLEKLIGTYIDKLPSCVSEKDGRLHAHFNQVGTDTGRFSSSDPNLYHWRHMSVMAY